MQKRKVTLRKCTGCQQMKDKKELIRVVKTQDLQFFIDLTGKANGRGAYICNNPTCFQDAKKSRGFERSFKMSISKEIYEDLERELILNE